MFRSRRFRRTLSILAIVSLVGACASQQDNTGGGPPMSEQDQQAQQDQQDQQNEMTQPEQQGQMEEMSEEEMQRQMEEMVQQQEQEMMSDWDEAAVTAFNEINEKYGPPAAVTEEMAVWSETGPWASTVVYGNAVPHNFPIEHPDVLEQTIHYKVPTDMYDEMAEFDGSVFLKRTTGELSARCDQEAANFLAVNLAYELAEGELDVEQARQRYGEEIQMLMNGESSEYTQGLIFEPMSPEEARDPDESLEQLVGGLK